VRVSAWLKKMRSQWLQIIHAAIYPFMWDKRETFKTGSSNTAKARNLKLNKAGAGLGAG
jgi:hypothetical protein